MDAVEDIKSKLSIEDVIGEYIELKRAGRNLKALSPFSGEKTASFMISPEKQIWHDFSSAKGGNMFSFVMEMEGVDFKTSLEILARKAGVDLSKYSTGSNASRTKEKQLIYDINELATKFYQLHFSKNTEALKYILQTRGYTKQTALDFRIGYSPNSTDSLTKFLKSKNYEQKIITLAGLSSTRNGRTVDMFRGRIMIPLMDAQGKVIGFTARLLNDDPNAPKYINTSQTLLYDKSRHIFGLSLAKESVRKNNFAIIVEGNLDVIASHQAGIKNVVATAGTAMTPEHLKSLSSFSQDIRLAFDKDSAGQQATERSIIIANKMDINLSIVDINDAKDPDELIKKNVNLWKNAISNNVYALDWLIEHYKKDFDISTAQGKRQFSTAMIKIISQLHDEVEKDHYITQVSKVLDISPVALSSKLGRSPAESKRYKKIEKPGEVDLEKKEIKKAQNNLISICYSKPKLIDEYLKNINSEMLIDEDARQLLRYLKDSKASPIPSPKLQNIEDYVKMLLLLFEELYQGLELNELQYEAARMQVKLVEKYVKTKKAVLASKMRDSTDENMPELLNKAKNLDKLLNDTKEYTRG